MKKRIAYLSAFLSLLFSSLLFSSLLFSSSVWAAPIAEYQAEIVARNWLATSPMAKKEGLGTLVKAVIPMKDPQNGTAGYYFVQFAPSGWALVPADDAYEPILSFGDGNVTAESFRASPWYAITRVDFPQEKNMYRKVSSLSSNKKQSRWDRLLRSSGNNIRKKGASLSPNADIRVEPLTKTAWSQQKIAFLDDAAYSEYRDAFYSYYIGRDWDRYESLGYTLGQDGAVGCAAVATGQLMYYFAKDRAWSSQWVNAQPVVRKTFHSTTLYNPDIIIFKRESISVGLIGGKYKWDLMPVNPKKSLEKAISNDRLGADAVSSKFILWRDSIAALLHDVGVLIGTVYGKNVAVTANVDNIAAVLQDVYGFKNAVSATVLEQDFVRDKGVMGTIFNKMARPNLDLKHPVIIGFKRSETDGGHVAVIDGYAYDDEVIHYHFNMGWSGINGWGAMGGDELGNITGSAGESSGEFTPPYIINDSIYNVFPNIAPFNTIRSPEIISGRVLSSDTVTPLKNQVTIKATWEGGPEDGVTSVTDEKGIYALLAPHNTTVSLQVIHGGDIPATEFAPQKVKTGLSVSESSNVAGYEFKVGNVCDVDFIASPPKLVLLRGLDQIEKIFQARDIPYQTRGVTDIRDNGLDSADIFVVSSAMPGAYASIYSHAKKLVERGGFLLATTDAHSFISVIDNQFKIYTDRIGMDIAIQARYPTNYVRNDFPLGWESGSFNFKFDHQGWPVISHIGVGKSLLLADLVAIEPNSGTPYILDWHAVATRHTYGAGSAVYTSFSLADNYDDGGNIDRENERRLIEDIVVMPIRDYRKARLLKILTSSSSAEHSYSYGDKSLAESSVGVAISPHALNSDLTFVFNLLNYTFGGAERRGRNVNELTVSLLRPDGSVYVTSKTEGSRISFKVPASENTSDGLWRFRVESWGNFQSVKDVVGLCFPGAMEIPEDKPITNPTWGGNEEKGVDPIDPVDPVDPIDPIDPVDPVDPIDPIDPVDPVDPIDPIDPVDPIDSDDKWEENTGGCAASSPSGIAFMLLLPCLFYAKKPN